MDSSRRRPYNDRSLQLCMVRYFHETKDCTYVRAVCFHVCMRLHGETDGRDGAYRREQRYAFVRNRERCVSHGTCDAGKGRMANRVESGTLSIFNGAEQIETILEELNNATGTIFVETSATEENTTIQRIYAQTIDGIVLDTEGYTPGGGAEVVPGIRVDVYEDGRIFIQNPMCVGMKTQTLSKADLMDREEVQMLCRSYYESYGLPCVTVVTGLELVYYNADGVLRPAWSLEQTWYPSAKGHITSQMLDGQTGEYLRQ